MKIRRLDPMRHVLSAGLCAAAIVAGAAIASVSAIAADATSLDNCPERKPILKMALVTGNEPYSPHPAETNFASTAFTRLHQMPLFGVNPLETGIDPAYGLAESWKFLPNAAGLIVKLRKGMTFNNGEEITAEDVAFSLELFASKFADSQINGTLRGIGVKPKVIDRYTVEFDFAKGSPTFALEMSPLVFPLYVTSKKHHSNGEISQAAFDRFRSNPMAAGPYRVVDRRAQRFITLVADRKDPLLGCPTYERIEIRTVEENGTRMNQFRTGQLDIISAIREMIPLAKRMGAVIASKPDANTIGLYFFQAYHKDNVFHDINVRKAATYAIDHKLIGETIWGGIGIRPWGCTWPPATEISTQNPRFLKACGNPHPYDPALARKYLAAAGYPPGKGPKINIEYSVNYPEEGALAEAMQPMLKAVGFEVSVEQTEVAERNKRRYNDGHINTIIAFGPGGRVTALAGAYSVWGPKRGWGPKHDKDVVGALERASRAISMEEYTEGMADLGTAVHDKFYGPGFFSAGSIIFVRKEIGDWGIGKSKGRGIINLSGLVTKR